MTMNEESQSAAPQLNRSGFMYSCDYHLLFLG